MTRKFSQRSLDNLKDVHPDLVRVITAALQSSPLDFSVIEGVRAIARQKELVAKGASQTMNSRHLHGLAVDLLPINPETGKGEFEWTLYHQLGPAVEAEAKALGVPITWGARWASFPDGPHFELQRFKYPDDWRSRPAQPVSAPVATPAPAAPVLSVDDRLAALEAKVKRLEALLP